MAKIKPGVKKYLVIALFVVASVLSAVFMGRVAINYSISDYLGDSTETKISLDIIEDEFGMTSDIQVMAEGVSVEEAKQIRDTLKAIPDVLNVNFDEYDENYYKNGNALFIVLVDGDEYSESASTVSAEIRAALKEYDGRTSFAGSVTEKQNLKDAITSEMVYILLIAVCLVAALLLLTSRSWLEPIVLLLTSGIAILINMGTNLIFGKISYITNSVAAILQLALSIDYSIVLIHNYRSCKETESDNGKAMRQAVRNVTKPVSASALTTIAGLVALLFMSFKIGFDIGIVLIKGIVISVITSLTFLPALLLALDKPMQKTKKKEIVLKGGKFCNFAFKANKAVVPVALALIIVCGALQSFNTYSFNDTKIDNPAMLETFGQNNSVVVVYPNGANNYEMEAELVRKVSSYRKEDGTAVLKNYTAYTNTVREEYDVEKASRKLELSRSDAELLFTMYHLYKDEARLMLTTESFVSYADELLATDADAAEFADAETANTVASLIAAGTLMNGTHTAEEFHTLVTTGAFEGTDLDLFSVRQMYGLYYYETVENDAADFKTMLTYFIDVSQREEVAPMFDEETVANLQALSAGIAQFNEQMETPMTKADFQGYMYQNYGATIVDEEAATIWYGYFTSKGQETGETIPFLPLMTFLADQGQITDEAAVAQIRQYNTLYATVQGSYGYDDFLPVLTQVATALTGETPQISATKDAVQQVYILYFYENGSLNVQPIAGRTFVAFVNETYPENDVVGAQLSQESKLKLQDVCVADAFLSDGREYTFSEMTEKLVGLQNSMQSVGYGNALGSDMVSGVYIKYAVNEEGGYGESAMAYLLLNFVEENMDENELLLKKMTDDNRKKVAEAQADVARAEDLFAGENYSRMILTVDLPNESDESAAFVEFLSDAVRETFGENVHIAGEIVSSRDLSKTFEKDNLLISIFTVVSIFLVVMFVFRSLSLPLLLVIIIQGAIWISMSFSLITGPMFFMSYIVVTCILMGATIDYGILMSTNYVHYRETLDKKQALVKSVEAAMPTVFTSGLILTICGFVIGFVASQGSISTVGFLVGRGALVSVIMIMFVLPSALYLLDNFILKLSFKQPILARNRRKKELQRQKAADSADAAPQEMTQEIKAPPTEGEE